MEDNPDYSERFRDLAKDILILGWIALKGLVNPKPLASHGDHLFEHPLDPPISLPIWREFKGHTEELPYTGPITEELALEDIKNMHCGE